MKALPKLLFVMILSLFACKRVETMSVAQNFKLKLSGANAQNATVHIHKGAGQYEPVESSSDQIYNINIPSMDGGYSQFMFFKYNKSIPEEYEVIQIKQGEKVIKELSVVNIKALKEEDGVRILEL